MPWDYISMFLLLGTGVFLMIIVLLQRGRGGGLAGAFGGAGGQSAFGTKAGDVFTKITVALAVVWVILAGVSGFALRAGANRRARDLGPEKTFVAPIVDEDDDDDKPVKKFVDDDADKKSEADSKKPDDKQKKDGKAAEEQKDQGKDQDKDKDKDSESKPKAEENSKKKPNSGKPSDSDK